VGNPFRVLPRFCAWELACKNARKLRKRGVRLSPLFGSNRVSVGDSEYKTSNLNVRKE